MQDSTKFRIQETVRNFAFAGILASALGACASNGALTPSAQQTLVNTCDKASSAITLASFFEPQMTPVELTAFKAAQDAEASFCSPSALAADLTPAAVSANIASLGTVIVNMQGVANAHTPVSGPAQ
jgi:hypothetical protein